MLPVITRNAQADAVARLLDGATVRVIDAAGGLLAELQLETPSAPPAADGLVSVTPPRSALAVGAGTAARLDFIRDGVRVLSGAIGSDLFINGAFISLGAQVRLDGLTLEVRA